MYSSIAKLNIAVILKPRAWHVIFVLFVIDFYGTVAKLIALTSRTKIVVNGSVPGLKQALLVDGIATSFGSLVGTTSIVAYVESGVGISMGGRTGVTAVTCGLLMSACLLFTSLISLVPEQATAGALLYVAYILIRPIFSSGLGWLDFSVLIVMPLVAVLTFSLDLAMVIGFASNIMIALARKKKVNPYFLGSAAALVLVEVIR